MKDMIYRLSIDVGLMEPRIIDDASNRHFAF